MSRQNCCRESRILFEDVTESLYVFSKFCLKTIKFYEGNVHKKCENDNLPERRGGEGRGREVIKFLTILSTSPPPDLG